MPVNFFRKSGQKCIIFWTKNILSTQFCNLNRIYVIWLYFWAKIKFQTPFWWKYRFVIKNRFKTLKTIFNSDFDYRNTVQAGLHTISTITDSVTIDPSVSRLTIWGAKIFVSIFYTKVLQNNLTKKFDKKIWLKNLTKKFDKKIWQKNLTKKFDKSLPKNFIKHLTTNFNTVLCAP